MLPQSASSLSRPLHYLGKNQLTDLQISDSFSKNLSCPEGSYGFYAVFIFPDHPAAFWTNLNIALMAKGEEGFTECSVCLWVFVQSGWPESARFMNQHLQIVFLPTPPELAIWKRFHMLEAGRFILLEGRVCVFGERGQCTFLPRYHINMKLQGGQILQWKPWEFAVNISRAPRLHYCSR